MGLVVSMLIEPDNAPALSDRLRKRQAQIREAAAPKSKAKPGTWSLTPVHVYLTLLF